MSMANIVVDSSIVIKWFVTEPLSEEARRVLNGYQSGALTLIAPDLLAAEIGNIVWKKVRMQGLAREDAQQIISAFRELDIELLPTTSLLEDAVRIAMAHERNVYDALYIALSEREQSLFITADERLVNAVNKSFPNTVWLANWTLQS
ncbi:MAG: PIN domain-containing protein [Chloroflexota bacterium]|nr:MAG: PIN domain-containing protein [Chloroflexota bacterium]